MVQINFASREVNCKIVYYGPGRCGKTTNLQLVHEKAPVNSTGELVSIATETDRTLYFDFLPLDLGTVAGMRTKFQLYTVPGQVYYDATRKLVLQGCDGVVFVADSNPDLMAENIESLDNLAKNLKENGLDMMDLPMVLQFNKRDLPNVMSVAEMNAKLNRNNWPTVEAVAVNGDGVFQTLKAISQGVIKRLNREQGFSDEGAKRPRASALGGKASASTQNKGVVGSPTVSPGMAPRPLGTSTKPPPPKTAVPSRTPMPNMPKSPSGPVSSTRPGAPPPSSAASPAVQSPTPRATANPFKDRLSEMKHQTTASAHAAQELQNASDTPVKKGCLLRNGAAAALFVGILFYLLK